MKRLYIILALAAMVSVACEVSVLPPNDPNNPSNEDNTGNNDNGDTPVEEYTEFMGFELSTYYREEMVELLRLIDSQEGEVDDELFAEMLTSKVAQFTEQYLTTESSYYDKPFWTSCHEWDGGVFCGSLMMMEDGTCYDHSYEGCANIEFEQFLHERGYEGGYYTTLWSYDAENHMLNTIYNINPERSIEMSAVVLYFDGKEAILVGHIAGVAVVGANKYNDYVTGICHELELYRLVFVDGRESFLEGYASPEEYAALQEEFAGNTVD